MVRWLLLACSGLPIPIIDSSRTTASRAMGRPAGPSGPSTVTLHSKWAKHGLDPSTRHAAVACDQLTPLACMEPDQQANSRAHSFIIHEVGTKAPHLKSLTSSGWKASTRCHPALSIATGTCSTARGACGA